MVHGLATILTILSIALTVRLAHGKKGTHDSLTVEGWQAYHDSWAVEIRGGLRAAEEVAIRHGFVNRGKVGNVENYYHFTLDDRESGAYLNRTRDLEAEQIVGYVKRQAVRRHAKKDYIVPVDPEWSQQWSLKNTGGATNGLSGMDLRVEAAWLQGIDGRGVVTTIIDDGVEKSHPDLKDNYNQYASWDFWDGDSDPSPANIASDSHGTNCAGEIGMARNSNCGVGVAHGGTIGGIRLNLDSSSDITEASAFSYKSNYTAVYSNSWGPPDYGFVVEGPGPLSQLALQEATRQGRYGRGSVYIWAAGNGGKYYDSCAADGYASSIYTIAVGSADQTGAQAYYDESCAAKMAVTYSYNSASQKGKQITTTTLNGKCTNSFTGTSASAPLLAGTVALTLQANPNLSWRDVQYLIAYTSDPSQLLQGDWQTNGGGRSVSQRFGFGAVDVEAMVTRAMRWTPVPPQRAVSVHPSQLPLQEASTGSPSVFSFHVDGAAGVKFVEHVILRLTIKVQGYKTPYSVSTLCGYLSSPSCESLDSLFGASVTNHQLDTWLSSPHPKRGDVQVELTSPQGTTSVVLPYRKYDFVNVEGYTKWPFMSVRHWSEDPAGRWNVTVYFRSSEGNVNVSDAELTVYGTADVPSAVRTIPKVCDKSCARACAGPGPDGCDACAKGYFRDASTLKCVSECPMNTTTYSGYCVAGYVIFPAAGIAPSVTISVVIAIVALTVLLVIAAVTIGACVCYRRRHKRRTRVYRVVGDYDVEEWSNDRVQV